MINDFKNNIVLRRDLLEKNGPYKIHLMTGEVTKLLNSADITERNNAEGLPSQAAKKLEM